MAAKCKPTECEECPEWIFTFADLVMLMMGFFVILWVLKPPEGKQTSGAEEKKWLETVAEIRKPFGWVPDPASQDPVDKHALRKPPPSEGAGGETEEPPEGAKGSEALVMNIRPGQQVSVGGRMEFDEGETKLSPQATRVADEIVRRVRGHRNILQIKGHAALNDLADEAASSQYMELSIRRAQTVADYLIAQGISPDVIRVQGCSTFEPVIQRNYGQNALTLNRRVEVEVTNMPVPERQDRPSGATVKPLAAEHDESKPRAPAGAGKAHH